MNTAEIKRLIRRCEDMEWNRAKLEAALVSMTLADENGDPWCRIVSRYFVSWGYIMADDRAKALPFCAEYFQLLEQYPHIKTGAIFELSLASESVTIALSLPQIPREQCQALLDHFASRSKMYNSGTYDYYSMAFTFQMEMGMYEQAERSFERFRAEPMEEGWDCKACKAGNVAEALLDLGRREEAMEAAAPLLTGAIKCDNKLQPRRILHCLLAEDLEHGYMEEAAVYAARLYRMGFRNRRQLGALGCYLLYEAVVGSVRSLSLMEKGIAWAEGMLDLGSLFYFYRSVWAVCAVLSKDHAQLPLNFPKKSLLFRDDGLYQTDALASWFYERAAEIGQKFDRRNGTRKYAQALDWVEKKICPKEVMRNMGAKAASAEDDNQ